MARRKLHKNIKLLAWFNFFLSFRFYFPILIIYFVRVTGSYALGASIFSIAMLSAAILEVPTGVFSDLIGRKKTLVLGAIATLISTTLYAAGGFYWVLAIGAVFDGLARALYSGNNQALLHDTLAETKQQEEYSEYFGKTNSAEHLGLAITAIIGGVVAYWSFGLVMWLSVIPAIVGFLISLKVIEPIVMKREEGNVYYHLGKAISKFRENAKLRKLSLSSIIGYGQGEAGYQFRAAFVETLWPVWALGIVQALSDIGAMVSYYYSGSIIKRFKALNHLLFSKIYSLVTNTIAFTFPTVVSPLILVSNSLFHGSGTTARSTLMQKEYTSEQRSTMESLNSLGGSLFFAIVSLGLGLVADSLSPSKALLLLQILSAISLYLLWQIFKEGKK